MPDLTVFQLTFSPWIGYTGGPQDGVGKPRHRNTYSVSPGAKGLLLLIGTFWQNSGRPGDLAPYRPSHQICHHPPPLFEIARTALIVKPDHLELSITGMAVQESRVRSKL